MFFLSFSAQGRDEKQIIVELTVAQPTALLDRMWCHSSMYNWHNFIKVRKPPGKDTSTATG